MRHLTKRPFIKDGYQLFSLIDDDGHIVEPFEQFTALLLRKTYAPATVKRYMEVVANFIDYLIEAQVFGTPSSAAHLNRAVDSYLRLRVRADQIRHSSNEDVDDFVAWAKPIIVRLGLRSIAINENSAAPLHLFLRLSEATAQVERERADALGLNIENTSYHALIQAVDGHHGISSSQKKSIKQASMLANVTRMHPDGIVKPRGLSRPRHSSTDKDQEFLDFPLSRLADLLAAATTARDRSLWALLAGSGLRTSEALTLRWENIDIDRQQVFVEDPNATQSTDKMRSDDSMLRFKGRAVSATYIFQPLRTAFFNALVDYTRSEYVAGAGHHYVFQDVRSGPERGRPMHEFSDTARNRSFQRALVRASIKRPRQGKPYTLHSLRHLYGVYMLNYLPVPGGYGLNMTEVQRLMGHQSQKTTAHYARADQMILGSKLIFADTQLELTPGEWNHLQKAISDGKIPDKAINGKRNSND